MRPTIIKPPISDFPFATGRQHVSLPPCGLAAASKGGASSSPAAGGPTFGRGPVTLLPLDDSRDRRRRPRRLRPPAAMSSREAPARIPPPAGRPRLPARFHLSTPHY